MAGLLALSDVAEQGRRRFDEEAKIGAGFIRRIGYGEGAAT